LNLDYQSPTHTEEREVERNVRDRVRKLLQELDSQVFWGQEKEP